MRLPVVGGGGSARTAPPLDLLRTPVLGAFLRWRHARTTLQAGVLGLAALIVLDGWFGPQLAPRNLAGVVPWVHWRGFVVLALLVVGNLFCMACPFMLPRRLAKRIFPARIPWPAPLRSKWFAVLLLLLFFWAYEAWSLWASPWLTAWIAATYFVLAFAIDAVFRGAAFCRWVCPIGQFHFVNSMVSPFEVKVRDEEACARCETKDCIRGRYAPEPAGGGGGQSAPAVALAAPGVDAPGGGPGGAPPNPWAGRPLQLDPISGSLALAAGPARGTPASGQARGRRGLLQRGCEMALYLPRKEGNLDCTFCMECIQACPHDNVGIVARSPLAELARNPVRSGVGRIQERPDLVALALLLVWAAFFNAFGMVEPVFRLQEALAGMVGAPPRPLLLALFFGVGLVGVPVAFTALTAWASRLLSGGTDPLRDRVGRYTWGLGPLGRGMWTAHYLFHFLVGALTVVPVVQEYLRDLGAPAGDPAWGLGPIVPEAWLFPIEVLVLQGGLLGTLLATWKIAQGSEGGRKRAVRAFLPWALLATALAGAGIWLLLQPMEMRGTFMASLPSP